MIGVVRGVAPTSLTAARNRRLWAAVIIFNQHGSGSQELTNALEGYDVKDVKKTLYLGQNKKCAYCERRSDFSGNPIEHYRPKAKAWRHERGQAELTHTSHYWWLTWTWTNLLFACGRCNNPRHKANYFQVLPGTACAPPTSPVYGPTPPLLATTAGETPMLINPADTNTDPITLLWWEPVDTTIPPRLWVWEPRWSDERGRITSETLRLGDLAADVARHVSKDIVPRVYEVRRLAAGGQSTLAQDKWNELLADKLLDLEEDFREATWKALELLVSPIERTAWSLASPVRP